MQTVNFKSISKDNKCINIFRYIYMIATIESLADADYASPCSIHSKHYRTNHIYLAASEQHCLLCLNIGTLKKNTHIHAKYIADSI